MDGDEIAEWQFHFSQEPMVDHFWIGAQICCVLASVMGAKGARHKVEDFMPNRKRRRDTKDATAIERNLRAALGG